MAGRREADRPAKLFTPESANATLPLVRAVVTDAMAKWNELARVRALLEEDAGGEGEKDGEGEAKAARRRRKTPPLDEHARRAAEDDARRLQEELRECLRELELIGASPKSFDVGLVDFPMRVKGGRIIELCWRAGEAQIDHWHEIGAGFPGRRPLSELPTP